MSVSWQRQYQPEEFALKGELSTRWLERAVTHIANVTLFKVK
jgi:hypothetical protein